MNSLLYCSNIWRKNPKLVADISTLISVMSMLQYGVVLDAGSTHTELFVFRWPATVRYSDTAVVEQIGQCITKGNEIDMK